LSLPPLDEVEKRLRSSIESLAEKKKSEIMKKYEENMKFIEEALRRLSEEFSKKIST